MINRKANTPQQSEHEQDSCINTPDINVLPKNNSHTPPLLHVCSLPIWKWGSTRLHLGGVEICTSAAGLRLTWCLFLFDRVLLFLLVCSGAQEKKTGFNSFLLIITKCSVLGLCQKCCLLTKLKLDQNLLLFANNQFSNVEYEAFLLYTVLFN